ncbi:MULTISPECIES: hypothetical protein [Planktothrix]|jgi:hypothetical protein|uniref:Uncharacterized protein n=2 Tax=Planktothrix TaxID=54304 RepID=A0A479ZRV8_PLAAG|nr:MULTISPECIES: hypothetical protein [Planktothrix]CAD5973055.1 hypothetical protein NO108_04288 [Planktothrix rubescens]MCF3569066.1 hypothetical protein [Planktothrix agardhii 1807]MCF3570564.1 hypothetical protein [Planktothrix agardhii 1805]MCF3586390.1 hypothetical protein [Planktothrix agardhii 1803]MCF3603253.1 hypothetical protein [Planktothrix agardhii 1804]
MTINIKLMPDYCSYSLWGLDPDNIGDINPALLPLSKKTIKRLEKWAATYDQILKWDDPASSGFATVEEAEKFEREGVDLWHQLREELAPNYEVRYFSQKLRKVINNPDELMVSA